MQRAGEGGIRFSEVIQIRGINPFVPVSADFAKKLKAGWRRPLPVLMHVNGEPVEPLRTNLMPAGDGSFYLYLNGIARDAAGVSVGDRVRVELRFDEEYRNGPQHAMPDWFRGALRKNRTAEKNWSALTPSRQKEILRYLSQLKSVEARERNLVRALRVLSGEPDRFMARSWSKGA